MIQCRNAAAAAAKRKGKREPKKKKDIGCYDVILPVRLSVTHANTWTILSLYTESNPPPGEQRYAWVCANSIRPVPLCLSSLVSLSGHLSICPSRFGSGVLALLLPRVFDALSVFTNHQGSRVHGVLHRIYCDDLARSGIILFLFLFHLPDTKLPSGFDQSS